MDNILFIPGIANPVSEINQLLFGQGQQGTFIAPSLTASLISGSTFGTGVETLPDLSPRNNPFSQATPSSRGAWFREPKTGRRNLFVNTHFTGTIAGSPGTGPANWIEAVSTGQIVSYDETTGKIRLATANTRRGFSQAANMAINSVQTASVRVNVISGTLAVGRVLTVSSAIPAGASLQWQINGVNAPTSGTALPAGESLLTLRATTTTDPWTLNFEVGNGVGGTTTGDVELWEPQFETGSARTTYQRVTTAFDVTESGQRDCFGVRSDGTDDFYTTAAINFNTPKLTIFAAIRSLTDVTRGVIGGTFVNINDFTLLEAPGATAGQYQFASRKVSSVASVQGAYTAPEYTVLAGETDRFLQRIRLNGVTTETRTDDTGPLNIGNVPLGLFHRITQNDRFFNGNLYALIVAGGSYPLSTIQRVERILSRITPTVNL